MMSSRTLRIIGVIGGLTTAACNAVAALARPAHVSVAAASNFVYALEALHVEFRKQWPDVRVTISTGASGSLFAQIAHDAPFDVFLSADMDYPRALVKAGHADGATLAPFAIGRLALWTTRPTFTLASIGKAVRDPSAGKVAIANIETAPYGKAARQALEKLGVWPAVQSKLVIGENITQTAQFVETGNADMGFVALSLILSPKLKDRGRWIAVPPHLHAPLEHGVVATSRGMKNPAVRQYLEFLKSDAAKRVLRDFGYE